MFDQAHELRQLAVESSAARQPEQRAAVVVLSGSTGGVGTTTIALHLAVAMKRLSSRVLLVDANDHPGDEASNRDREAASDLDHVLSGRRAFSEVTVTGPGGIQVVPPLGLAAGDQADHLQPRRIAQRFDWIFIDAGSNPAVAASLWPTADTAIVVATTDPVAVVDAYTLIKAMARRPTVKRIASVVNRGARDDVATNVQRRLVEACRRFPRVELEPLGTVPTDGRLSTAMDNGTSVISAQPRVASSMAVARLARQLASMHSPKTHLNLSRAA